MPRSPRSAVVKSRHPGARRARARHRRPAGAQHGHDRRLDRQQRSGRGLSRRRCSALGATDAHRTSARSPPTTSSRACSRRRSRADELITAVSLPGAEEGRLREVPAIRRRASRWSACSSRRRRAACASRSPARRAVRLPRRRRWRRRSAKSFTADGAKARQDRCDGLQRRPARAPEYRAHLIGVMAARAVDGGRLATLRIAMPSGGAARGPPDSYRRAAMTSARSPPPSTPSLALLDGQDYVADRRLATAVFLALKMRPPAVPRRRGGRRQDRDREGARRGRSAGRSSALQCYEGLDIASAVYEWNYRAADDRDPARRGGAATSTATRSRTTSSRRASC